MLKVAEPELLILRNQHHNLLIIAVGRTKAIMKAEWRLKLETMTNIMEATAPKSMKTSFQQKASHLINQPIKLLIWVMTSQIRI